MKPETKRVLILRVRHSLAKEVLPFDKLYFFPTNIGSVIARVFPYSLVLALTSDFTKRIQTVIEKCTARETFPLRRRDEKKTVKAKFLDDAFKDVLENYTKYWAVVPTLYLSRPQTENKDIKASCESHPAYICAAPKRYYTRRANWRWQTFDTDVTTARHRERMKVTQSAKSYLLVAGEVYRPICVACPNHMSMLNGHCYYGSKDCYDHLSATTPATFVAGMKAYKEFIDSQTKEPELEELQ